MSEYVSLDMKDFEDIFKSLNLEAQLFDKAGVKEYLFKVKTSHPKISVVVYSSLDKSNGKTRGVGEDAIRLVFWHNQGDHPLGKGKKIYRVTSKESVAQRVSKTIKEFLAQAPKLNVMDWDYVKAVLRYTAGGGRSDFASSLLESLDRYGRLTEGQLAYVIGETTPKGRKTMEAEAKWKGWIYDPTFEEPREVEEKLDLGEETGEEVKSQGKSNQVGVPYSIPVISDTPGMDLLPTDGYPYKFPLFNPIQSLTYPFRGEDSNIVIGASTSAGKTICAELLMEEVLKAGKRVIYLSPLKSLTQEKYDDWKTRFQQYKITILTGDYTLSEEKKNEISKSPIIVLTSEMADSRTRRMEAEGNDWLKEVGLVIVDETHILSTNRGHAVESGIMRFTSINKEARIIFLSATMPNVDQLGGWLKSLNGKETRVIKSIWRPVELNYHYIEYPIHLNRYGQENYGAAQEEKKRRAVAIVQSKPIEKFLIFTHDKGTGRSLVKMLAEEGIDALFHNADLDLDERLETEAAFSKREGGLRVLVSTSTLAWGRNLPARNVIVVGIHRGIQEVDELDIIQMAGRAGRYGIDTEGHVYLIIPQGSTESWKETFKNPRPITSVLKSHQVMAFHVLAEIQNRVVTDSRTLLKWYSRSLAYFQGEEFTMEDSKGLLDDLEKMEMVINKGTYYTLTGLGKVSGWLYYSPYDVYGWYRNFHFTFRGKYPNPPGVAADFSTNWGGLIKVTQEDLNKLASQIVQPQLPILDDTTLAWALTDIPSNDWGYIPKEVQTECEEMKWKLRNRGIQASDAIHVGLAAYKCLTGAEVEMGTLKASVRAIKYDIRRICQALSLVDQMYGKWEKKEFWKSFPIRINYGIPEEMLDLVKLPGIGGAKAHKMWEKGIHSLEDVIVKTDVLKTLFIPTMAKKLQVDAKKIKLLEKGEDHGNSVIS